MVVGFVRRQDAKNLRRQQEKYVGSDFRNRAGKTFLNRIIAIDETWIRDIEPEMKSQSNVWKSLRLPRAQKVRRQQSEMEGVIFAYQYDKRVVIDTEQVLKKTRVSRRCHKNFLRMSCAQISVNCVQECCNVVCWFCTIMRPHTYIIEFLKKSSWERLRHPPYSFDLRHLILISSPSWRNPFGVCVFRCWKSWEEKWPDTLGCSTRTGHRIQALSRRWQVPSMHW